jgi:glycosyltransferase involved in cell wall biosynthesis
MIQDSPDNSFDVTVSVWNDFWSPYLVSGLHNAGLQVIHHTTARQKAPCARFVRNIPASTLNHLAFRGLLPSRFAHSWSRSLVDSEGARLLQKSKAFWGWSGCSLKGLQAAKAEGKPAILERGSSHCVWQKNCVAKEHRRLGLPLDELSSDKEIAYDLAEYDAADVICVPSQFVRNTFLDNGVPEQKLFLNPYGVDFEFWSQCDSSKRIAHPFTFLWVATLMPRKGIAVLLEAWRKADLKDAHLVLVGGVSPSTQHLLRNLPKNIVLKPFLDHKSIREEMSRAHVYVLPSFEEGMARSVLEAAAAGLPVLITEETGATDLLHNGTSAWVVPSGDVNALAESLVCLSSDQKNAIERGTEARLAVRDYSWESYGERAALFLAELVT